MRFGVPPVGPDLKAWANDLRRWLGRTWDALTFRDASAVATQDGLILWDTAGYPVVSKSGEFRQIVLADGYLTAAVVQDVVAASPNTAYSITWDTSLGQNITVSGDEITIGEAGLYAVAFKAQVASTSGSTVNFWFWPRVNNADPANSALKVALHQNDAINVVTRTRLYQFAAGDTLKAMWATSSVAGFLSEEPATAFAPETPAATLSIWRVQQ